jgi:acid phosphatase family membrane protein YuiD
MLSPLQQQLHLLFQSPLFLAAIFSWLSAQFIKTIIKLFGGRVRSLRELVELLFWRTGGMPSSHSALVSSITTSIGFRSGVTSDVFVLSLCFALVVIRDAVGVRRSSGLQAKTLNEIGRCLEEEALLTFKPVKEVQGHKPFEVVTGCFLGFFIGAAFSTL